MTSHFVRIDVSPDSCGMLSLPLPVTMIIDDIKILLSALWALK
jgi:hypothetical protein